MNKMFVVFAFALTACSGNPTAPEADIRRVALPKTDTVKVTVETPQQRCERTGGQWLPNLRSVWLLVNNELVHKMEPGCLYVLG